MEGGSAGAKARERRPSLRHSILQMAKSAAFQRIHGDVMQIARKIPKGRVSTFAAIGQFLDVVPRQVAFLLARVNDDARESVPWYRVVADDGSLGKPKYDARGRSQRELLEAEGVTFTDEGEVSGLSKRMFTPTQRNTGVKPTPRPSGLSVPTASRRAR